MQSRWVSLVLVLPTVAFAQNKPSEDNVARADALFKEAQALQSTDLNAACIQFAESYALNPHALGTLLNVALCDEKLGRLASALEKFKLARDVAAEMLANGNKDVAAHQKAAMTHITALAPRIPHVTVELVPPEVPGTTIVIDGTAYTKAKLAKLAVDPGTHDVVVTAPGYQPQETTFAIAEGEHHTVAIPRLEKSVSVRSTRRTIGVIVGGAGAAVGITGIVVGFVARSRYNDTSSCHPAGNCDLPEDYTKRNNALALGNVGTVVGIAGGAAIVVGAVLWYTGRKATESPPRVTLLPHLEADAAGIAAVGRF
ncbi:MAG: PEGA domain-containing protein [Kofleriaceae bacterium]